MINRSRHSRVLIGVFMGCVLMFSLKLQAQTLTIDPEAQYRFAEQYFTNGKYFQAATEFERLVHFFPESPLVDKAIFQIGQSRFHLKQFNQAANILRILTEKSGTQEANLSDIRIQAVFLRSMCLVRMSDIGTAVAELRRLASHTNHPEVRNEALYRAAWIFIENGLRKQAEKVLSDVDSEWKERYRVREIETDIKNMEHGSRKSPFLAGTLSLLPGAGYLYCGRKSDAFTSFIVNTAMTIAAVEAFENGQEALGTILGFLEFGFYSGNIYGSVSSAYKYNADRKRDAVERMKRKYGYGFSVTPWKNGMFISLYYSF